MTGCRYPLFFCKKRANLGGSSQWQLGRSLNKKNGRQSLIDTLGDYS